MYNSSAVFADGSSLEFDAVIFATSYKNIRDTMREMFGDAVIEQTGAVWGVKKEGEINGCYGPSGHPGPAQALEIKAIELGCSFVQSSSLSIHSREA
ncbi:hypothetical protein K438DRAFT_1993806 [Mycena galopus ATCC 62051]|nr:hypothetical protein K438DRAFT_1995555 [Mycena galopus ATCC 62051]KAF8143492.1 hypothetical protein K438DRAFT_1993806 [Mycena galopus ATCC 62051]